MSAGSSTRILAGGQGTGLGNGSASLPHPAERPAHVAGGPAFWISIALVSLLGALGISPEILKLYEIWTADPLRSIGIFILGIGVFLTLRVWRDLGWELEGSWWGLLAIGVSFFPLFTAQNIALFWAWGGMRVNFIPNILPMYLYGAGIVLLFGGFRVWRKAWFPLLLLLCAQPVPEVFVRLFDLPMQGLAAHVARSFAHALGLAPTDSELLRLMFTPSFGMFIAPGCDGMRGAVTLGYGALIVGYLRRMPILRWAVCVLGAVALGHLFNLIRLCALVLYYKIALGNVALENQAKLADYLIGGSLFLVAALFFLWISLKAESRAGATRAATPQPRTGSIGGRSLYWRAGIFAALVLTTIDPAVHAMRKNPASLASEIRQGRVTAAELSDRIPREVGSSKRLRVWQEEVAGTTVLEAAAFSGTPSGEIEVGVWLGPTGHSIRASLTTQGETPRFSRTVRVQGAGGTTIPLDTALYDDGTTVTLIGDTRCRPSGCDELSERTDGLHLGFARGPDRESRGERAVSIFVKIQVPRSDESDTEMYNRLSAECQQFLSNLDTTKLSREFQ